MSPLVDGGAWHVETFSYFEGSYQVDPVTVRSSLPSRLHPVRLSRHRLRFKNYTRVVCRAGGPYMPKPNWVQMTNPKVSGEPATVSQQSFELTWKSKGWKLYTPKKEN